MFVSSIYPMPVISTIDRFPIDCDFIIHGIDQFLSVRNSVTGRCDISAASGHLVDALAHFRADFTGRYAWFIKHELAVDPSTKAELAGKGSLECGQIVARLAGIPYLGAHLHHIAEDRLNLSTRVLVDDDVPRFQAIVDPLHRRLDDGSPCVRGYE
jgi:hypothetical protein